METKKRTEDTIVEEVHKIRVQIAEAESKMTETELDQYYARLFEECANKYHFRMANN